MENETDESFKQRTLDYHKKTRKIKLKPRRKTKIENSTQVCHSTRTEKVDGRKNQRKCERKKNNDEFVFQNNDDFVFQNDEFDSNHEVPNQMENSDNESGHLPKNNTNQEQKLYNRKRHGKKNQKKRKTNTIQCKS